MRLRTIAVNQPGGNDSGITPQKLKNVLDNLDPKLTSVFLMWALRHPRYLRTFCQLVRSHNQTMQRRESAKLAGLKVPPFLILSITSQCNLRCTGCYAAAAGITNHKSGRQTKSELNRGQWRAIIAEASELGVFGFVIAGGEPFVFPGLLELCEEFPDRFFIIVTNGTAITEADYHRLKHLSNIAIIVSIEGGREVTDMRRGKGVYEHALNTLQRLRKIGVLTGISVTVNRLNYDYWMNPEHLESLIAQGVRIGAFIEYIPNTPEPEANTCDSKQSSSFCSGMPDIFNIDEILCSDQALMLTEEERAKFRLQILNYRATNPIYLIHSPGDEEFFGGCVSAGRGFAHITPSGDLTPCPVSNIATHNLATSTLREGLASPLFKEIRENGHLLENGSTPCALFAHPEEVDAIARAVGAYRTDCKQSLSPVGDY